MLAVSAAAALLPTRGFAAEAAPPVHLGFKIGSLEVAPSGFFEAITAARSNTARDGISTRFGAVPLSDTPVTIGNSFRHSRVQAKTWMPLGPGKVTGYVEADFLDRPPAEAFRFRQYYGQYSIGDWEFSAGQEWSLLRPNRQGVASDRALMNTRVVDPAYHVGLMGVRNRQVRVTRHFGNWHAVAAFEEGDDFTAKLAQDGKRLHWELIGIGGREGRYGGSVAAVVHVLPSIDWVSQQAWVREGGRQALSTVPNEAPATSTIQGIEAKVTEKWQLFGYGGLVYGGRSSGNRIVYEWSAGFSRETWENRVGHMVLAGQYAKLGRALWSGPTGGSHFVEFSLRQYFGGAR